MSPDAGIPGWFIALFVLAALIGVGTTIWRISTTRKIARDAGLDPNTATAVGILSNDGVSAAYLASSIAARSAHRPDPASDTGRSPRERLAALQALHDEGVISAEEYEAQRKNILGSI